MAQSALVLQRLKGEQDLGKSAEYILKEKVNRVFNDVIEYDQIEMQERKRLINLGKSGTYDNEEAAAE